MASTVDLGTIGQEENSSNVDRLLRTLADGTVVTLPTIDESSSNIDKLLTYIIENGGIGGSTSTTNGVWYDDAGEPTASAKVTNANVGDFYLNTTDSSYYVKRDSGWVKLGTLQGVQGEQGTQGEAGTRWHRGSINPQDYTTPFASNVGDFYLNWQTSDYFVKQTETTWQKLGNLKGQKGQRGAQIYTSNVKPTNGDFITGDIWFNASHGDISVYNANNTQNNGGWEYKHNIRGHMWYVGEGAPTGKTEVATAKEGELYLDKTNTTIYRCTKINPNGTRDWGVLIQSLKGEAGAQGKDGVAGKNGATWHTGNGDPNGQIEGGDFDLYLDGNDGKVWKHTNSRWEDTGIILKGKDGVATGGGATGPQGPQGVPGTPGSKWFNGEQIIQQGQGSNGDYFLHNTTGDVYEKQAGTWKVVANIKGKDGSGGVTGTGGTTWHIGNGSPQGVHQKNEGDYYINRNTGEIFRQNGPYGSDWGKVGTLISATRPRATYVDGTQSFQNLIGVNGWMSYGNGHKGGCYIVDGNTVSLEGAIKRNPGDANQNPGGTHTGTLIFTLPADRRPTNRLVFCVPSGETHLSVNTSAFISVESNGQVRFLNGNHRFISLNGISFTLTQN